MSQLSRISRRAPRFHPLLLLPALIALVASCRDEPPTGTAPPDQPPNLGAVLGSAPAPGEPLPLLSLYERRLFERGAAVFETEFTPDRGLGPLFNDVGCAECHSNPVPGAAGDDDIETHASAFVGGVCNDLSARGGPVIQDSVTPALHAALGIDKEPVPAEATAVAHRTVPSLLGFGLLDAVPTWEILALADPNDLNGDGISGRPNLTPDGRVGRFGRKAQIANLRDFNAGAFVNEMGITSPLEPNEQSIGGDPIPPGVDPTPEPEISQEDFNAADAFVHLLAPPAPLRRTIVEERGLLLFVGIGCAACHAPSLVTGPSRVPALSFKVVYAYTDLLLHDMGPNLADICLGRATPSEFRTEPLMGLRFKQAFLHDGRAGTIEQAIRLHDGEAARARRRFAALSDLERGAVLSFLGGL